MPLDTSPRLTDPDALFAALVAAHDGLDTAASRQLDAQLVLLLANHIGDLPVVLEALAVARSVAAAHGVGRRQEPPIPRPGGVP